VDVEWDIGVCGIDHFFVIVSMVLLWAAQLYVLAMKVLHFPISLQYYDICPNCFAKFGLKQAPMPPLCDWWNFSPAISVVILNT